MEKSHTSKARFVLPLIIGFVFLISSGGFISSLLSKQLEHYAANSTDIVEKWTKEGMKEKALEQTVYYFERLKSAVSSRISQICLYFLIQMVIAIATDNWFIDGKNVNSLVELIAMGYYDIVPTAKEYFRMALADFTLALVVIASLGALYIFTCRKFHWKEQLFYATFLLPMVQIAGVVFASDYKMFIEPTDTPIEKYAGIDADLKDRIIKAANAGGIATDHVIIRYDHHINASAIRGLRFKYIFIHTATFDALTADQLMIFVYHEVGHVVNNHVVKGAAIRMGYLGIMFAVVIFTYRKVSRYYNGLAAWALSNLIWFASLQVFLHFSSAYVRQEHEHEADYCAYSREGYLAPHIEAEKICALLDGVGALFDYEDWVARFRTHPSSYKRILVARSYGTTTPTQ